MPRPRTGGWIIRKGKLFARVSWRDPDTGKLKFRERRAPNKSAVPAICRELMDKLDKGGPEMLDGERVTFAQLVAHHKNHRWPQWMIEALLLYFGKRLIRNITPEVIAEYKQHRLATKTCRGESRAIRTVNYELATLRGFLLYAFDQGWIKKNPFRRQRSGQSLIQPSAENRRARLLSLDEEQRLLTQCVGRREHLRLVIIAAIDTGLRKSHLLALSWAQIDFEADVIRLTRVTSNKRRPDFIGLTKRLKEELQEQRQRSAPAPAELIFGGVRNIKKAFTNACRDAKIFDLHFHDLRHRYSTDLILAGIPKAMAMKAVGHTQELTFDTYLNMDIPIARSLASAVDRMRQQQSVTNPTMDTPANDLRH